jgi:hypothetical protein
MRSFITCTIVLAFLLFASGYSDALTIFDISGPAANNVDTSPATLVTLNTAQTGIITDLKIALEIDANCCVHDLEIDLMHNGITLRIFGPLTYNGGDMNAILDDEAVTPLPISGDVFGTFLPANSLSVFDGEQLAGDWTLSLLDQGFPGEGDDLVSWRIFGEVQSIPEPSTILLLGGGLLGLVFFRKKFRK